jgi:hypothetical protein
LEAGLSADLALALAGLAEPFFAFATSAFAAGFAAFGAFAAAAFGVAFAVVFVSADFAGLADFSAGAAAGFGALFLAAAGFSAFALPFDLADLVGAAVVLAAAFVVFVSSFAADLLVFGEAAFVVLAGFAPLVSLDAFTGAPPFFLSVLADVSPFGMLASFGASAHGHAMHGATYCVFSGSAKVQRKITSSAMIFCEQLASRCIGAPFRS